MGDIIARKLKIEEVRGDEQLRDITWSALRPDILGT
jgi:hypothetical protein